MPNNRKTWMGRSRRALVLCLTTFLTVGAQSPAFGAEHEAQRPLKGVGTGTNVITFGGPTTFVAHETAELSLIGRSAVRVEGTSVFAGDSVSIDGVATIVAPNGDQLTLDASGSGVFSGPNVEATVVGTVTGGTGRFDDAEGTITDQLVMTPRSLEANVLTVDVESVFTGTISY